MVGDMLEQWTNGLLQATEVQADLIRKSCGIEVLILMLFFVVSLCSTAW